MGDVLDAVPKGFAMIECLSVRHEEARRHRAAWYRMTSLGLMLISVLGCSTKATLPELCPVHGKVVYSDGKPLAGGSITFESQNDRTVSTMGVIGADGTFTLSSFKAGARAPGAVSGPHTVFVTLPSGGNMQDQTRPVELPAPCTIKPGDNEVTLTLPRKAP